MQRSGCRHGVPKRLPSHHRIGTDAINHTTATDQTKRYVKDCGSGRAVLAGVSVDAGEVARCHVD